MPAYFACTLFVSACLLFLVQPLIARVILPQLGGTPAVWNTCMVFFQAVLLAGYAYAHYSIKLLGVRRQSILHAVLLLLPFLTFLQSPIDVVARWQPPADSNPIPWVLAVLAVAVGIPFFVVSTSAPLLQRWFAETGHPAAKDPYFLYAASNLGSMLTLFAYPVLLEPTSTVRQQLLAWQCGYAVLVALTMGCAVCVWRAQPGVEGGHSADIPREPAPSWKTRLHWIALAFIPSSLMLGVTTYLTTDIAAIPLLWILPLALYLLSFIVVFSRWAAALRGLMVLSMPGVVALLLFFMYGGVQAPMVAEIALHLGTLFLVAMVCHGELARTRPAAEHLTGFYLLMSLGGVLGGLFNALIAPVLFTTVAEYPIALVLACLFLPDLVPGTRREPKAGFDLAAIGLLLLMAGLLFGVLVWRTDGFGRTWETLQGVTTVRALLGTGVLLLAMLGYVALGHEERTARLLDAGVALAVGVFACWLIIGMRSIGSLDILTAQINNALELVSGWIGLPQVLSTGPSRVKSILIFGVPLLLCCTLVLRPARFGLAVAAVVLADMSLTDLGDYLLLKQRSFYGVMEVRRLPDEDGFGYHEFVHGTTLHGKQSLDPDREMMPLKWFHPSGPIAQLFQALNNEPRMDHVAIIGLGTGTIAAFGRPGQDMTYYEIDPTVLDVARDPRYFTFVKNSKARIEFVLGDGRLKLKDAPDGHYGLLVVDAFSSDAIPVHLMTKEALQLYLSKLRPDGVMLFHISNRYVNLSPVLANLADNLNLAVLEQSDDVMVDDNGVPIRDKAVSHWVALARKREQLGALAQDPRWTPVNVAPEVGVWTDDFSNLFKVFDWR